MTETLRRERNSELLRRVFLHQNGLAAATALATLDKAGVLGSLRERNGGLRGRSVPAGELVAGSPSPWAVAASIVAACDAGWLTLRDDERNGCVVSATASREMSFATDVLLDVHHEIRQRVSGGGWSPDIVVPRLLGCLGILAKAKASIRDRTSMPDASGEMMIRLLEGMIAVPVLPRLATEYDYPALAPLFAALELGETDAAMRHVMPFFAPMYGLAGSYAEVLLGLPDRIAAAEGLSPLDVTQSIDRSLNVRASAAAHRGYFQAATRMVVRLFDELPLSKQPRAILDVGCGDGTWLRAIYEAVAGSTERGKLLSRHPLHLVGVDLDPVALEICRRNLRDLPATCIAGDVGQPTAVAQALTAATGIDVDDVLSVRAFVDHNRPLTAVSSGQPAAMDLAAGVYATASGSMVGSGSVSRDWASHYARWRQICSRHGLVVIEAHTVSIAEAHERLEKSHTLALRYYHALSGQSPVPYESFRAATRSAGLDVRGQVLYPASLTTTSISWLVPCSDAGSGSRA